MFRYDLVQVFSNSSKEKLLGEISVHFQPSSKRVVDDSGKLVEVDLLAITKGALTFEIEEGNIITYNSRNYTVMKIKDYSRTPIPHAEILLKQFKG